MVYCVVLYHDMLCIDVYVISLHYVVYRVVLRCVVLRYIVVVLRWFVLWCYGVLTAVLYCVLYRVLC